LIEEVRDVLLLRGIKKRRTRRLWSTFGVYYIWYRCSACVPSVFTSWKKVTHSQKAYSHPVDMKKPLRRL